MSPAAQNVLDQVDGAIRPYLEDLLEKATSGLWRKGHRHTFKGTDLEAYKPGVVERRLAGISKPGKLYVCELYKDHNTYERDLPNRQQAHYDLGEFRLWTGPSSAENAEPVLGQEKLHQQQLQQIRTLEQGRNQFQEQIAAQERKLEHARRERDEDIATVRRECEQTIAEAANRQRETMQAEISRLKQDLDQAKQAQQAIRETVPPWHRRLGAVFSPSLWFETKPRA